MSAFVKVLKTVEAYDDQLANLAGSISNFPAYYLKEVELYVNRLVCAVAAEENSTLLVRYVRSAERRRITNKLIVSAL